MALDYIENDLFQFLPSPDVFCHVSVTGFTSLVDTLVGIASSEKGLEVFAITTAIQRIKPVIKKTRKNLDKIVLIAKTLLIRTE